MLEVRFQARLIQSCKTESVASKKNHKLTKIGITPVSIVNTHWVLKAGVMVIFIIQKSINHKLLQ